MLPYIGLASLQSGALVTSVTSVTSDEVHCSWQHWWHRDMCNRWLPAVCSHFTVWAVIRDTISWLHWVLFVKLCDWITHRTLQWLSLLSQTIPVRGKASDGSLCLHFVIAVLGHSNHMVQDQLHLPLNEGPWINNYFIYTFEIVCVHMCVHGNKGALIIYLFSTLSLSQWGANKPPIW